MIEMYLTRDADQDTGSASDGVELWHDVPDPHRVGRGVLWVGEGGPVEVMTAAQAVERFGHCPADPNSASAVEVSIVGRDRGDQWHALRDQRQEQLGELRDALRDTAHTMTEAIARVQLMDPVVRGAVAVVRANRAFLDGVRANGGLGLDREPLTRAERSLDQFVSAYEAVVGRRS